MKHELGDLAVVRSVSERLRMILERIDPLKDVTLGRLTVDEPVYREQSPLPHGLAETWKEEWERG
jgi:hypothetical protein